MVLVLILVILCIIICCALSSPVQDDDPDMVRLNMEIPIVSMSDLISIPVSFVHLLLL